MSDFLAGEPVSWERYQRHLRQEAELRGAAEQERDALTRHMEEQRVRLHTLVGALRGQLEEARGERDRAIAARESHALYLRRARDLLDEVPHGGDCVDGEEEGGVVTCDCGHTALEEWLGSGVRVAAAAEACALAAPEAGGKVDYDEAAVAQGEADADAGRTNSSEEVRALLGLPPSAPGRADYDNGADDMTHWHRAGPGCSCRDCAPEAGGEHTQATGGPADERSGVDPTHDDAKTPTGFAATTPARGPVEAGTTCDLGHHWGPDGGDCTHCHACFHCFPADWRGNIAGPCEKCGKAIEEGTWWVTKPPAAPPAGVCPYGNTHLRPCAGCERDDALAALTGMMGERDSEREIAQRWERKAEDLEVALTAAQADMGTLREAYRSDMATMRAERDRAQAQVAAKDEALREILRQCKGSSERGAWSLNRIEDAARAAGTPPPEEDRKP